MGDEKINGLESQYNTEQLKSLIYDVEKETANNSAMQLNILLSYTHSWEIALAFEKYNKDEGKVKERGEETDFLSYFQIDTEIDLVIRTGNQQRLSDFCL